MNDTYEALLKYWKDRGFTDEQCDECMALVQELAAQFHLFVVEKDLEKMEAALNQIAVNFTAMSKPKGVQ